MKTTCLAFSLIILLPIGLSLVPSPPAKTAPPEAAPAPDASFLPRLAASGKAAAQALLGERFLAEKNYGEAFKWLRRAAEQGDVEAQQRLGYMYEAGLGVARDEARAGRWYRRAMQSGDVWAHYKAGLSYAASAGIP
jgi:hypothetical protein